MPAPRPTKLCTHNLTENLKNGERLDAKSSTGINQEGPPAPPGHVAIRRSLCATSHPPKGAKRFSAIPSSSEKTFFWAGEMSDYGKVGTAFCFVALFCHSQEEPGKNDGQNTVTARLCRLGDGNWYSQVKWYSRMTDDTTDTSSVPTTTKISTGKINSHSNLCLLC